MAPSDLDTFGDQMSLSSVESAYQGIQLASTSLVKLAIANNTTSLPITALPLDPCNQLPSMDEVLRKIMSFREKHGRNGIFRSNI